MEQIITFDPTVEQLNKIVESTSKITAEDLSDDKQLSLVKETRLNLRTARTTIEKQGKSMREEAVKYQKDVIAREKELIAIIEPEEKRLKALEDEAALIKVREARKELLPMRTGMLTGIVPEAEYPTPDMLLDMDNDEFILYLNIETAKKNERDRLEIDAEKTRLAAAARLEQVRKDAEIAERNRIEAAAKLDEERRIQAEAQKKHDAEVAAQKAIDDAKIEAARVVEEARLENEAKAAAAQKLIDDAKIEADRLVQVEKDRIAAEAAREEAAKREEEVREQQRKDVEKAQLAKEKYLVWAKEQGWTPELALDFKTEHVDGSIVLWKKVGVYTLEK